MSVLNNIDLDEVKRKLYEKLKPSGWGDKLKTFILSSDFDVILEGLLKEARIGNRFTPPLKKIFRAFEECPYADLKVIIIGQDPYPQLDIADGIAFSCSSDGKVQTSLKYIFQEIETTVYTDGYKWDPNLARWSNQGVLLLNNAFTTGIGKVGSHYKLWQPLMAFVLDILNFQNPGLIYVFMGARAKEWAESIPDNNFKLFTSHPASATHSHNDKWDSGDLFNKINQLTEKYYNQKIIW